MNINKLYFDPAEKPLERPAQNGGFCGILRTVGCIGDSLSSGEFESRDENGKPGYHDFFEYSWGQFMARDAGLTVYNFSRGGMTASEYVNRFAEKMGYWDPALACRAYIIALGVNDICNLNVETGSAEDVHPDEPEKNADTFMGNMGRIMSRLRVIQPKSRIFLVTIPKGRTAAHNGHAEAQRDCMYALAKLYPFTYVIDLYRDGPVYDDRFYQHFFMSGHMNAAGYRLTATLIESYIDYIIRHNMDDFAQIGFVGTEYHNTEVKW